jgi:hypothetical protein
MEKIGRKTDRMMTGRGEIRTQNHVGDRLKSARERKNGSHGESQTVLVRKGERQDTDQCNKGRWRYL